MKKYDISVIVATYHPDLHKLMTTLSQILIQRGITFEIIISDDGSDIDWFDEIEQFFAEKKYNDYRLVKNKENIGTVRNIYGSVCEAKGKYVFCTSPGDYLHDEMTLCDLFNYAEKLNAGIVFGNAVYYSIDTENKPEIHSVTRAPFWPEMFNSNSSFKKESAFFFGNYVVGAAILRERNAFRKQLETIIPYCRYVEDNTSIALALLQNDSIMYYDRSIVFYEYGIGISTSKNEKWAKTIDNDFLLFFEYLTKEFPGNKPVAAAYHHYLHENGIKEKISRIIHYPTVCVFYLINKTRRKKHLNIDIDEESKLLSKIVHV